MKIVFFGLGSIGTRHARLLAEHYSFKLYAYRTRKGQNKTAGFKIQEISSWRDLEKIQADVAFITNPTALHIATALKCAKKNIKLFIEKPIDASTKGLDALLREVKKRKLTTYVAYNLRFHPVIDAIKKFLNNKKINQVSVYNSSYLPDWRPEQDHRKSYSAHKKMGGGVILDLSHEFDFIDYLFGPIQAIEGTVAKKSNVTHDAEDLVDAIIQTKRAPVNLHLDIFSRGQAERSIYVDFEGGFIRGDLIENKIEGSNKGKKFHRAYKISRDYTYRKQLKYFLYHRNNPAMMNNLAEASQLFRKIIKFREQK